MTRSLADFIGSWNVTREIMQADGARAWFKGRAVWRPGADGAAYEETGVLETGQGRFEAGRRYLWGDDLSVRFEDGRFFHMVPPEGGTASHRCDPDQYDAEYDFTAWPDWSCIWQVRGPRKDYTMISRYRRAAA